MAEQVTKVKSEPKPQPAPQVQKKGGAMKWILLTCGGCLLLLCCMSSITGLLCATSEDFKQGFEEGYCQGLEDEGLDPSEDPFGICN